MSDLEQILRDERDRLDPRTVLIIERNLKAIDAAINEARMALNDDPANPYLNSHLADARRRKLDLLRTRHNPRFSRRRLNGSAYLQIAHSAACRRLAGRDRARVQHAAHSRSRVTARSMRSNRSRRGRADRKSVPARRRPSMSRKARASC